MNNDDDKDGKILAIYRNTEFRDFTDAQKALSVEERRTLIGTEANLANLVKYQADLSAHIGKEIRIVLVDNASEGWGVIYFDELHTYYTETIGSEYKLAVNQLANLTTINGLIDNAITAQGDYTTETYEAYANAVNAAKEAIANPHITQARVDELVAAINTTYGALALRQIEVLNAETTHKVIKGQNLELNYADYFNTNELSSVTFEYASDLTLTVNEGVLTLNTTSVNTGSYTITLKALHKGEVKQTVTLMVNVTEDKTPSLKEDVQLEISQDKYGYGKDQFELDLANYINNPGSIELTYTVDDVELEGSVYKHAFDDEEINISINVVVSYVIDEVPGQLEKFTINLTLYDSTANRLANGDFEAGIEGWTVVGKIGNVSTDTHYWVGDAESAEGFAFGMDGEKMFSAYAPGAKEGEVGTLTSSTFTVGGSGFVTFKLGAMKDSNYVYVDVVDAETKEILARYYNGLWQERTNNVKSGCTLIAYKANLSAFNGKEVFFRISDNADSGYGLFFADSFITYYETEPVEGFNDATPVDYAVSGTIYDVFNGGFEMGGNQGWWNVGEPGAVTGADAFFSGVAYGKEGNFLYSGVEDHGAGNGREGNTGVLTSSVFEIGGSGYITYMLGGGNALCYVQVIDSTTNEVLVRYRQQARNDAVLVKYVADLSAYMGRSVRIQVVDNATNSWGCVSFDNVITYHTITPEGLVAIDVKETMKYEIVNGSFENGLDGWTMSITEAGAHNTLGWVESSEHDAGWYTKNDGRKDGNNLFTFCKPDGTNCENSKGTLQSSTFSLKQNSFVTFRFGGAGTRDVHIQLCRADGSVIATFYNEAPGKVNTEMYAYYYQYTGEETECFFRVVDNSTSNYGCFVVDDFRVNLEAAPEGFIAAIQ